MVGETEHVVAERSPPENLHVLEGSEATGSTEHTVNMKRFRRKEDFITCSPVSGDTGGLICPLNLPPKLIPTEN